MTSRRPLVRSLREAAKAILATAGCCTLLTLAALLLCGHPFEKRSMRERARWDLGSLGHALETYSQRTGQLPREGGWHALVEAGVLEAEPVDPWGHPYAFSVAEDGQGEVSSLGADGQVGGDGEDADLVRPFTVTPTSR